MKYILEYTFRAKRDLDALDRKTAQRIIRKLDSYLRYVDPLRFVKPLSGPFQGFYRFRIGDYRAIFLKRPSGKIIILIILRIKHRKEVYEIYR